MGDGAAVERGLCSQENDVFDAVKRKKKMVEPGPIPIQPYLGPIRLTGPEPSPAGPVRFLKHGKW